MALANAYTLAVGRIPELFTKIRDGQAPAQFTQQLLKDWGFTSSADRAFIAILKAIGFLSPDGRPTSLYHEYRDHSKSKKVLGRALRQSYGDIFLIKEHPTKSDRNAVQGKFKSFHNVSDKVAQLMANLFFSLLDLADLSEASGDNMPDEVSHNKRRESDKVQNEDENGDANDAHQQRRHKLSAPGLHYNIQIHLPSTKDVEVYNAIFKSLKEHLLEN